MTNTDRRTAQYQAEGELEDSQVDIHEFFNFTDSEHQTLRTRKKPRRDSNSREYWTLTYETEGSLYLRSSCIFIGDTDNLDFDWLAAVKAMPQYKFRVYRTYKGYRFFILNELVRLTDSIEIRTINAILNAWQCDEWYIKYLWAFRNYSARLLPKVDRLEKESYVTKLLYTDEMPNSDDDNWRVDTIIRDFIRTHDAITLDNL